MSASILIRDVPTKRRNPRGVFALPTWVSVDDKAISKRNRGEKMKAGIVVAVCGIDSKHEPYLTRMFRWMGASRHEQAIMVTEQVIEAQRASWSGEQIAAATLVLRALEGER